MGKIGMFGVVKYNVSNPGTPDHIHHVDHYCSGNYKQHFPVHGGGHAYNKTNIQDIIVQVRCSRLL